MRDHDNATADEVGRDRTSARRPEASRPRQSQGLLGLQAAAGNAAVVQMLREAGHPWAVADPHQHTSGCGHRAEPPAVQRSTVHDVLRSGGRPLDEETRGDMEARLGADFSDVRIHTDAAAKASATEVGARAYTSGSHVVIGEGGADRHTLAHELTHVIQQRRGPVAGAENGSGLKVSDPSDRFEREAEATARQALSSPAPVHPPGPEAGAPSHGPAPLQRVVDGKRGFEADESSEDASKRLRASDQSEQWVPPSWDEVRAYWVGQALPFYGLEEGSPQERQSYRDWCLATYHALPPEEAQSAEQSAPAPDVAWPWATAQRIDGPDGIAHHELDNTNTIAVYAGSRGDMYHVRAAMVATPGTKLLVYGVHEGTAGAAQGLLELTQDLVAKGSEIFWSERSHEELDLQESLSPSPGVLSHKGDTASTRYLEQVLTDPRDETYGWGEDVPERERRRQNFYKDYAEPTAEQSAAFGPLLAGKGFRQGTPYVLVNFRNSGHAGTGNAPALDTGRAGMTDIMGTIKEQLGAAVVPVPVGDFPEGYTADTWPGPHLVKYFTWEETKDRRSQLALLHHLNTCFDVLGAIGMRSGVTDQFAFAGIRTISIDITPYQQRPDRANGMQGHPSKGWNRGMKLENSFGPHYGRVFLKEPRDGDWKKDDGEWRGPLGEGDRASVGHAVAFYFGQGDDRADWDRYEHRTHPMSEDEFLQWLGNPEIGARQRQETLRQLKDQEGLIDARRLFSDAAWAAYEQACQDNGIS